MHAQINTIRNLHANGGPTPYDYPLLEQTIAELQRHLQSEQDYVEVVQQVSEFAPGLVNTETMQGFVISKPHGYAGDFEVIERLYDQYTSDQYAAWDTFWHAQPAAKAVRNRKDYFKSLMRSTEKRCVAPKVLNIASGPVRDLYEFLAETPTAQASIDCVDQDKKAIAFAQKRCEEFGEQVTFHCENALRFNTDKKYDLVWSAGLFDYFDDALFVVALKRLLAHVKEGGELVIGNFSDQNPTKPYMEVMNWHLHHRSEETLIQLAEQAGANADQVWVGREAEGVNLFLHIQK